MSLGQRLAPHLPYLRRYARALCGTQASGDHYVRATLQAVVDAPDQFPQDIDGRTALYQMFHGIWNSSQSGDIGVDAGGSPLADDDAALVDLRLSRITPMSRQMLLLSTLEGFSRSEVATITGATEAEVDQEIAAAMAEIDRQTRTSVLIIEDEPIIALDIESIVAEMGHDVVGIAATRDEAVAQATSKHPGLVLADIQLADDSSGIDAVADILERIDVPVIFITAFPERLLTGDRAEPAFLITKPFQERTLRTAIAQALFFNRATVPA